MKKIIATVKVKAERLPHDVGKEKTKREYWVYPFKKIDEDSDGKPLLADPRKKVKNRPSFKDGKTIKIDLSHSESEKDKEVVMPKGMSKEGGIWAANWKKSIPFYYIHEGRAWVSKPLEGDPVDANNMWDCDGWFIRCDQAEIIDTFEEEVETSDVEQPSGDDAHLVKVEVVRDSPKDTTASPFEKIGEDASGKPKLKQPPPNDRPWVDVKSTLTIDLSYSKGKWDADTGIEGGIWAADWTKNIPFYYIHKGSGFVRSESKTVSVAGWFIRADQTRKK